MATTIYVDWNFDSDAMGLVEEGNSSLLSFLAWFSSQGSPNNGCIGFGPTSFGPALTNEIERAYKTSTSDTYETLGVPAGKIVTQLQISAWKYRDGASSSNLVSRTFRIRAIDDAGASLTSADLIDDTPGLVGSTWTDGTAGTVRNVLSGKQSSNTPIRIVFETEATSNANGVYNLQYDTVRLAITYDDPPGASDLAMPAILESGEQFPTSSWSTSNDLSIPSFSEIETFDAPGWINGTTEQYWPMPPDPDEEVFPELTLANEQNLKIRYNRDLFSGEWTDEFTVDEGENNSAGCVVLDNGLLIAVYTKNNDQVFCRKSLIPDDWSVQTPINTGFLGKVRGLAINNAGILCALVNKNQVIISRDFGDTWVAGAVVSGLPTINGKAYITSSYDTFVLVYIMNSTVRSKVSRNGGVTFI